MENTEGYCHEFIIFLLTGFRIYTGEYKLKARMKGGHYEGRGLWIRLYRYASQLVRSLLPKISVFFSILKTVTEAKNDG